MRTHKQTFFKGISFSYLYILVYLLTGLLTTPILLKHFQADYFALLMLVYAIITYINNIRFGLPESLAALLAKSKYKNFNIHMIKKTLAILSLFVVSTLFLFYLAGVLLDDWRILLGDVYELNKSDVLNVFYILIILSLLRIPLDLSLSVFIGFHEVYLEKTYKIINLLVNFILVLFVAYFDKSIVFFALFAGLLDLAVSLISFIHSLLRYDILNINDSNKKINSTELLKSSILFFQLSITQTIIWGAGIFFVSHILSLHEVTLYSLTMKIYIYIFYAYIIINSVIAPLYGKYFSDHNWKDIKKVFSLMILLLPFFGGFIWIGTLYFMSDIISLWTGSKEFYIGSLFVFFMGSFFYFTGFVNSYITLLYSIGETKSVVSTRWIEVFFNLVFSLIATYFFGLVGIAIGISFSIALISMRRLPKYLESKTKGKVDMDFNLHKKHFIYILLPSVLIALLLTNVIELLIVKIILFFIMSVLYTVFSWYMISPVNKMYIKAYLYSKKKVTLV